VRPRSVEMARRGESSAGFRITEKRVVPVVPQHPGDFEMLRKDLATMKCEELLYRNWDIQDSGMLAEVVGKAVPLAFWESYIRGKRKHWTRNHWCRTYNFPDSEYGLESGQKGDSNWVKERFSQLSEKDGFKVEHCQTPREKRLLQFLVPILSPDKRPDRGGRVFDGPGHDPSLKMDRPKLGDSLFICSPRFQSSSPAEFCVSG
jgi:hypothetical protein